MTDDLYERYKEALRVGHVAVLRGALDEALEAYRAAAEIAPSRALPHTSRGGVLLRLGHLEEALVEYAAAVARAPHDEGSLLGQAEALTISGQRVDAAAALDHVSEIQEASGRLPEAADTLRRAMELEESVERGRRQRGLLRQIRLSAGDQAAERLLARALRLRDEPAAGTVEPARGAVGAAPVGLRLLPAAPFVWRESQSDAIVRPVAPSPAVSSAVSPAGASLNMPAVAELAAAAPDPEPVAPPDAPLRAGFVSQPAAATESALVGAALAAASPVEAIGVVGVMDGALDTPLMGVGESQHQPTGDELLGAAEAADLAGDTTTLRSLLLWTARAYAREGRFEAGLDATHRLLQRAPSDVDAHLVLVELYVARDWNVLATEKLVLLGRLAELNDDEHTRQRLRAVVSRTFPMDERLSSLCS